MHQLPLPIAPRTCWESIILPALDALPPGMDSRAAQCLLLAIALQESGLEHRHQINGPARGLWQFERGGGVAGVLRHLSTSTHARLLCLSRGVMPVSQAVYDRLSLDDILAAGFARLLLWTDPAPIPGDEAGAWAMYVRTWRPGAILGDPDSQRAKHHAKRWPKCWQVAVSVVP